MIGEQRHRLLFPRDLHVDPTQLPAQLFPGLAGELDDLLGHDVVLDIELARCSTTS
jgi:hypothetical protein